MKKPHIIISSSIFALMVGIQPASAFDFIGILQSWGEAFLAPGKAIVKTAKETGELIVDGVKAVAQGIETATDYIAEKVEEGVVRIKTKACEYRYDYRADMARWKALKTLTKENQLKFNVCMKEMNGWQKLAMANPNVPIPCFKDYYGNLAADAVREIVQINKARNAAIAEQCHGKKINNTIYSGPKGTLSPDGASCYGDGIIRGFIKYGWCDALQCDLASGYIRKVNSNTGTGYCVKLGPLPYADGTPCVVEGTSLAYAKDGYCDAMACIAGYSMEEASNGIHSCKQAKPQ